MVSSSSTSGSFVEYPYPSEFNVRNFVPDLTSDLGNYFQWKKLMLDFLKSRGLNGFVNGSVLKPRDVDNMHDNYKSWKRSNDLVRGWILITLSKEIRLSMLSIKTAQNVWMQLQIMYLVENPRLRHKDEDEGEDENEDKDDDEDEGEDENEDKDDDEQLQRRMMSYQSQEFRDLISDNWNMAAKVIEQVRNKVCIPMSEEVPDATLLRVAISQPGRNHFVEQLVKRMTQHDLEGKKYESGKTALHIAASIPNMVAAKLLVDRNSNLPNVPDHDGLLPLVYAVRLPSREMVLFLWKFTANDAMETYRSELFIDLVKGELYDFALYCISGLPRCDVHVSYLRLMAGASSSFRSGISFNFWRKIIYSSVPTKSESIGNLRNGRRRNLHVENFEADGQKISLKQKWNSMIWDFAEIFVPQVKYIREKKTIHEQAFKIVQYLCTKIEREHLTRYLWILGPTLFIAAYGGTYEIVEEILVAIPPLATFYNAKHQTIFQYAIVWRQERVFNLLYQIKPRWQFLREVDISRNNSLHLAGYLGPQQLCRLRTCAPGAALQMQRELQWLKEVEKFSEPSARNMRNDDGMTPAEVFTDSHQELVKEGERWMKDTSSSCTIVAALIATVLFAASITLPGGNNNNGQPSFFKRKAFMVFGISDALGLFSSVTSGLMFLSILTSRCAEDDFLYALPKRLIIGLVTLFVSLMSIMVAFGSTLYLVFGQDKAWVLIPVVALASLPVTSFVALQFPLLVEIIKSTYGPGIFGKQSDRSIRLFS